MTPASKCCPCCHGQNTAFLFNLNYGVVYKCVECRQAFTLFYADKTLEETNEVFKANDFIKARLYDQHRLRKVARNRLKLLNRFVNHGSILEFGACTGEFLYEAGRKGYDVYSVDKYDSVLNINKTERLKAVTISDADLYRDDGKYDAIVAFHLIEHLTNPGEFFSNCHRSLNSDGLLFLEMPNFGAFSRRIWGRRSGIFYDYHVCHFDRNSLEHLLGKYNYRIIFTRTIDETVSYMSPLYNPIRNAIWKTIKGLISIKNIPVDIKVDNALTVIEKEDEEDIINSFKAKIYRFESSLLNGFSMIFSPLSLLLNIFGLGSYLQVIARKRS